MEDALASRNQPVCNHHTSGDGHILDIYARLSLELLIHPLLVLFTWQKHFRKYNYRGVSTKQL